MQPGIVGAGCAWPIPYEGKYSTTIPCGSAYHYVITHGTGRLCVKPKLIVLRPPATSRKDTEMRPPESAISWNSLFKA